MSQPTLSASEILRRRMAAGGPQLEAEMARLRANRIIGTEVYQLREEAGLSHAELAAKVGVTPDDVEALEEADYDGDSLSLFIRIASALGRDVEVRTVQREPVAA
jgi:DNA-binding XRE family transcriptional regulator